MGFSSESGMRLKYACFIRMKAEPPKKISACLGPFKPHQFRPFSVSQLTVNDSSALRPSLARNLFMSALFSNRIFPGLWINNGDRLCPNERALTTLILKRLRLEKKNKKIKPRSARFDR